MVFWFAYSFYLDGTLGVLVAVIGVFSNGMAYLMSFVYGMVYLLHKMDGALDVWDELSCNLITKIAGFAFIFGLQKLAQSSPFRVPCGKSTPA